MRDTNLLNGLLINQVIKLQNHLFLIQLFVVSTAIVTFENVY